MAARYETVWDMAERARQVGLSPRPLLSEEEMKRMRDIMSGAGVGYAQAAEAMALLGLRMNMAPFQGLTTLGCVLDDSEVPEPEETPALKLTPDARKDLLALMASKI